MVLLLLLPPYKAAALAWMRSRMTCFQKIRNRDALLSHVGTRCGLQCMPNIQLGNFVHPWDAFMDVRRMPGSAKKSDSIAMLHVYSLNTKAELPETLHSLSEPPHCRRQQLHEEDCDLSPRVRCKYSMLRTVDNGKQTACKSMPESKEITEGSACYGWRRDFRMRVLSLQIRQLQGSMCTSSKQT